MGLVCGQFHGAYLASRCPHLGELDIIGYLDSLICLISIFRPYLKIFYLYNGDKSVLTNKPQRPPISALHDTGTVYG